jgi:lipopolysaccharide transport system ATP-binding protein
MSDSAIKVENLSKRYKIGVSRNHHDTLRDHLMHGIKSLFGRNARSSESNRRPPAVDIRADSIWALKDVSFDIKHGEVVGFVGRNGAGKSTLLKILSRITEPTLGRAEIHGRIGSLLEVGTGFHPELTGRENIYLNGAVLGMKKVEIQRKFDEIVDFAEIDGFIETPVKRYSSGMYVRLAFAVAAHLEPEILIVDEVLAVGDVQFQQKCLGKMGNVAREGRTVLFVTHNLAAITQLCPSSIFLRQGTLVARGPTKAVIDDYLCQLSSTASTLRGGAVKERSGDGRLCFTDAYLCDQSGHRIDTPGSGSLVDITLEFVSERDLSRVQFMLTLYSHAGIAVTHCSVDACGARPHVPKGRGRVVCRIPKLPLPYGRYRLAIAAADETETMDLIPTACVFSVETSNFFPRPFMPPAESSTVLLEHSWQVTAEAGCERTGTGR